MGQAQAARRSLMGAVSHGRAALWTCSGGAGSRRAGQAARKVVPLLCVPPVLQQRSVGSFTTVHITGPFFSGVSAQSQPLGKRTLDSDVSRLSAGRVVETEPG